MNAKTIFLSNFFFKYICSFFCFSSPNHIAYTINSNCDCITNISFYLAGYTVKLILTFSLTQNICHTVYRMHGVKISSKTLCSIIHSFDFH